MSNRKNNCFLLSKEKMKGTPYLIYFIENITRSRTTNKRCDTYHKEIEYPIKELYKINNTRRFSNIMLLITKRWD